ncbi:MAG: hypothetical protein M3P34_10680, partial [Actinomycetota bacterium]|nr:hypothetical protein [Actinomycetota bacterium]
MIRRVLIVLAALAAILVPIATPAMGAVPTTIATVVGTPGVGSALRVGQRPHAVVLRGSELYVADAGNNVVRAIRLSDGYERIVAGNGGQGFIAADATGLDALTTQLHGPVAIAFDAAGNLYIVESSGGRVRKVTPSGAISTVAGNGGQGFSGDGGPAVSATLFHPEGIAADAAGNLFIADSINHRIRRVDAGTGIITTFAGAGVEGDGGDGGPATSAELRAPEAVALDAAATGLLVADTGNSRIRRIDLASRTIVTVAGNGTAGASGDGGPATAAQLRLPAGITPYPEGGFLIADTGNHTVRIVDGTGRIFLIAGNGEREYGKDDVPANVTNLYAPEGVAVGPDRTIFIGDTRASRIRWVDTDGTIHALGGTYYPNWNGDGPGTASQISPPRGVAVAPNGDVYIADSFTHLIRRLRASDGYLERVAGTGNQGTTGDGGPAGWAEIGTPMGLTVAPDGDVIFADDAENRVRRIDAETWIITTIAGNGDRGFSGDGGPAIDASLAGPSDVAVTAEGSVLIADQGNNRIRKVSPGGNITTVAGTGAGDPSGDGGPAATAGVP